MKINTCIQLNNFASLLFVLPVHYGRHNKTAIAFIKTNLKQLKYLTTGIISVNLTARKPDKNDPQTNPYLIKLLNELNWQPNLKEVFAGALKYPDYSWYDRFIILLIMKMTKGPTNTSLFTEFTDWNQVNLVTKKYIQLIKQSYSPCKKDNEYNT